MLLIPKLKANAECRTVLLNRPAFFMDFANVEDASKSDLPPNLPDACRVIWYEKLNGLRFSQIFLLLRAHYWLGRCTNSTWEAIRQAVCRGRIEFSRIVKGILRAQIPIVTNRLFGLLATICLGVCGWSDKVKWRRIGLRR